MRDQLAGRLALGCEHGDRPGCSECDDIQEAILFRDFLRDRRAVRSAGAQSTT